MGVEGMKPKPVTRLLLSMAREEGLTGLAKIVAEECRNPVIITDATYRILTGQPFLGVQYPWPEHLPLPVPLPSSWPELKGRVLKGTLWHDEGSPVNYTAVALGEERLEGFLFVLEMVGPVNKDLGDLLTEVSLPVLIELKKEKALWNQEKKYKREFLLEILYNNFEDYESLVDRGKMWGWNLTLPYALLVLQLDEEQGLPTTSEITLKEINEKFNEMIVAYAEKRGAIALDIKGQVVILLPYTLKEDKHQRKKAIEDWVRELRRYILKRSPSFSFSAGVGEFYTGVTELYKAYQEAKTALKLGVLFKGRGTLTYFSELGIIRLLYKLGELELRDFWQGILGPLLDYDREQGYELLNTLKIYFQCNGDQQETARKLFIHPNTLKYRLKKIEEITALKLDNIEALVNMYLALQVMHLQRENK